eukprot:GFYU01032417.1.p1 GENE.GFYU01032417.1~~GFYU01032417.1.p1  ORF type:complete len:268 (-),score=53.68 GFYU01032417.1:53-856(-)
MYFNYASDRPIGQFILAVLITVISLRYVCMYDLLGPTLSDQWFGKPGVPESPNVAVSASSFVDVMQWFYNAVGQGDRYPPSIRRHLVTNYTSNVPFFIVHVVCTGMAFILCPLQVWASFRRADLVRHRWLGRLYMVCMLIGMATSIPFALGIIPEEQLGGLTACIGFLGMAAAETFCGLMGWYHVRCGNIPEHKVWMIRANGILWGSFFWFRVALALIGPHIPLARDSIGLIANLSWVTGWLGADLAISMTNSAAAAAAAKTKAKTS